MECRLMQNIAVYILLLVGLLHTQAAAQWWNTASAATAAISAVLVINSAPSLFFRTKIIILGAKESELINLLLFVVEFNYHSQEGTKMF